MANPPQPGGGKRSLWPRLGGEQNATAQALEDTGVSAYTGALAKITSADLQTVGATIATVEARHAAYLRDVNGKDPFPSAFDTPLSKGEVLDIAAPFFDCE